MGIVIQNDLKWSKQCVEVLNSCNKILGMITHKATSGALCAGVEAILEEGHQIA